MLQVNLADWKARSSWCWWHLPGLRPEPVPAQACMRGSCLRAPQDQPRRRCPDADARPEQLTLDPLVTAFGRQNCAMASNAARRYESFRPRDQGRRQPGVPPGSERLPMSVGAAPGGLHLWTISGSAPRL